MLGWGLQIHEYREIGEMCALADGMRPIRLDHTTTLFRPFAIQ
jgi:hypothetical protein